MSPATVIFRSAVFDDVPKRGLRRRPLGADLASYLVKSLRDRGARIDEWPVAARGGWRFEATVEGTRYIGVVEVASLRDSKEDVWLVRVQRDYGFWPTLLGRGRTLEECYPLCRELGAVLKDSDVFQGVEWLSQG